MTSEIKDARGAVIEAGVLCVSASSTGLARTGVVLGTVEGFTASGRVWVTTIVRSNAYSFQETGQRIHVGADRLIVVTGVPDA